MKRTLNTTINLYVRRIYAMIDEIWYAVTGNRMANMEQWGPRNKHNMNSRIFLSIATLLATCTGCATERLYVKVVDDEGIPVPNATVNVYFTSSPIVLGDGTNHHYEGKTDTNGNAVVKFNCNTSDFAWRVEADGYYRGNIHTENFKGEDVILPLA